jgi:putative glutamine amidotransferase
MDVLRAPAGVQELTRLAPVIGISAHTGPVHVAVFDITATFAPSQFVDHVTAAGGQPVLLPPVPDIDLVLDRLDGLLVLPGPDIDPALYGAEPHPLSRGINAARDEAELALIAAALDANIPVLGICRGAQLMNVLRGGTLHQHLPDLLGHDRHLPGVDGYGAEPVRIAPSTCLARVVPTDQIAVPCHHHQGIDQLGIGVEPAAWSIADDIVEAVEVSGQQFAVGVQWHAERGGAGTELFLEFIAASAR